MSTNEPNDGGLVTAMSLRDHFAGLAMASMVANTDTMNDINLLAKKDGDLVPGILAIASYQFADAMLAERAKGAK